MGEWLTLSAGSRAGSYDVSDALRDMSSRASAKVGSVGTFDCARKAGQWRWQGQHSEEYA